MADAFLRCRPLAEVCFVPTTTQSAGQFTGHLSQYRAGIDGDGEGMVVAPEDLARWPGQSLIFQNSPRLYEAAGLRATFGRAAWPAVGLTHALSGMDGMLAALFSAQSAPFDRLVCTSKAGERAFTELQRQVRSSAELTGYDSDRPASASRLRTHVIPLGIDTDRFAPAQSSQENRVGARARLGIGDHHIVFLYCGRFSAEYKMDPFPLLAAFATAFPDDASVSLIMAGDTSGRGHIEIPAIAARLGVGRQVSVVPDPSAAVKLQLYQAADIFVSFSDNLQETFGLTVVEAMSCGLPVLVSDWSGYRETVVHGETGFLAPTHWRAPDDYSSRVSAFTADPALHLLFSGEVTVDVAAAIAAMRTLAANRELREKLGRGGRDRVLRTYAWPVVMTAYRELFAALLDEAAVVSGGPGCGYPPFGYDRRAVFGHFATTAGALPGQVERTRTDRVFAAAVAQVAPEAAEALALTCPPRQAVAVTTLIDCLTPVLGGYRAAVRVLQLLLKYGAIVAVPAPSSDDQSG
jgi:glycosyltransferase involved in cell wall biosynthesis